jgi:hypothetical protein
LQNGEYSAERGHDGQPSPLLPSLPHAIPPNPY